MSYNFNANMQPMPKGPGHWQNQSHYGSSHHGWQNEEENPVISPAILNLSWTKDTIDKWNSERRKKYPTIQKGEKAARIKQVLDEKRQKLHEIRQKQFQERKESFQNSNNQKRGSGIGKRKNRNRQGKRRYGAYEFPDFDYEDDKTDVKDGIFAFCGTKSHESSCRFDEISKPSEDMFAISDDDDEMMLKNRASNDVHEDAIEDSDDDDPPEIVPFNRVAQEEPECSKLQAENVCNKAVTAHPDVNKDIQSDKTKVNVQDSAKKPPLKTIHRPDEAKDYVKILRGKRHDQTFLEKLLEDEILKERYEILQCLHYVCSNNFFGIGSNDKKET